MAEKKKRSFLKEGGIAADTAAEVARLAIVIAVTIRGNTVFFEYTSI